MATTPRDVMVKMGEFPAKEEPASLDKGETGSTLENVSVENLTPGTARKMKLAPETTGVVVVDIDPSSDAAETGLRASGVIQ